MNKDTVVEEILDKVNQDIKDTKTHITKAKINIEKLERNRKGLISSIDFIKDENAKQVLVDGLISIDKEIEKESNLLTKLSDKRADLQDKKNYILSKLQSICTHSDRVEDHYDYHRNIYYEKCIYCGKGKL